MPNNIQKARADAIGKKEIAREKIQAAKVEAENRKRLKNNPPPKMVELPEITGDTEADSLADLNAVQAGFRERYKQESKRFELATDSEYWACICFQTREQKERFLSALKIIEFGDKFLDGQLVAQRLGVDLPSAEVTYNPEPRIDKEWLSFV